jgi:anaerobic selenocysteine-containing dehydrogenase
LPERLKTPNKTIDCAPDILIHDFSRLRAEMSSTTSSQLKLIGRRHVRSCNSWLHNSQRLIKGPNRCTLLIHPDDARARNLGTGSRALMRSRTGEINVLVEVSDEMMPGVVSLPHGFGHDRGHIRLNVAGIHAGVSINDVTDERLMDPISGNAAVNGTPVDVIAA